MVTDPLTESKSIFSMLCFVLCVVNVWYVIRVFVCVISSAYECWKALGVGVNVLKHEASETVYLLVKNELYICKWLGTPWSYIWALLLHYSYPWICKITVSRKYIVMGNIVTQILITICVYSQTADDLVPTPLLLNPNELQRAHNIKVTTILYRLEYAKVARGDKIILNCYFKCQTKT